MNTPTPVNQMCDECGKAVARMWRVHKGHKYCSTCYAREFKRRLCPKCGNFAKLLISDPNAICLKCQVDKPCARCGSTNYEVGKITAYGPVCGHCATYFSEPDLCEVCGKPSKRLTRVSRLGHDHRVCPSCARADHGVCEACRRSRLLELTEDGRMLCKACHEQGEVPCPACAQPMPAGRGKQCESCYWRGLLEKRVAMDCTALSAPAMAEHFRAFGEWLGKEVGHHKAAIRLHRYLSFFLEIEKEWKAVPEYAVLLKHFGTLRLRRVLLPMKWMQAANLVVPDSLAKQEDSDQRRIAATLDKVGKSTKERTILDDYLKTLMVDLKDEKTTLRSIRLAMTPAAALLLIGREMGLVPPNQKVLDYYLENTPGQRAAVSGFVCHVRDRLGMAIILPKVSAEAEKNRRRRLETELIKLLQEDGQSKKYRRRLLATAISYFHGLPKRAITGDACESVALSADGAGVVLTLNGEAYWLPQEILGLNKSD
jgi:hypothetical protein